MRLKAPDAVAADTARRWRDGDAVASTSTGSAGQISPRTRRETQPALQYSVAELAARDWRDRRADLQSGATSREAR